MYLNESLDYEVKENYDIELQLESLQGFVNPMHSTTMISIHVVDVNDNKPRFILHDMDNEITKGKFYAALPFSSPLSTTVTQIKADDEDSGKFGKLQYKLKGEGKGLEYFGMDPTNGLIKSKKTFEDISENDLPFRMIIEARDNPNSATDSNVIEAPLVVSYSHLALAQYKPIYDQMFFF